MGGIREGEMGLGSGGGGGVVGESEFLSHCSGLQHTVLRGVYSPANSDRLHIQSPPDGEMLEGTLPHKCCRGIWKWGLRRFTIRSGGTGRPGPPNQFLVVGDREKDREMAGAA